MRAHAHRGMRVRLPGRDKAVGCSSPLPGNFVEWFISVSAEKIQHAQQYGAAKCVRFILCNSFCARQKPPYCEADYAAACVADHQTPALCRKYPPRTYSYALFSLFFSYGEKYLWHDVIDDYIVSHSAVGKCGHLFDVRMTSSIGGEICTYSEWLWVNKRQSRSSTQAGHMQAVFVFAFF